MKIQNKLKGVSGLVGKLVIGAVALSGTLKNESPANADDYINIQVNSDNISGSMMAIRHRTGSVLGYDNRDSYWSDAPHNPNSQWIEVLSSPYSIPLGVDSRANDPSVVNGGAMAPFDISLSAIGGPFTANNTNFQFQIVSGLDTTRPDYLFDLVSGSFHETGSLMDRINNYGGYTDNFTYNSAQGATLTLTPQSTITPEPSTLALLVTGAASMGLAGYLNKRRNRGKELRDENRKVKRI